MLQKLHVSFLHNPHKNPNINTQQTNTLKYSHGIQLKYQNTVTPLNISKNSTAYKDDQLKTKQQLISKIVINKPLNQQNQPRDYSAGAKTISKQVQIASKMSLQQHEITLAEGYQEKRNPSLDFDLGKEKQSLWSRHFRQGKILSRG